MRSLIPLPIRLIASAVAGYLIGSVLFADVVTGFARRRRPGVSDIRSVGSGNPGAANAISHLGKGWASLIVAGDMGKGAAAPQLGRVLAGDAGAYVAATAAVAGHCFPARHGFRGGKGVATSAGTTWVAFPIYVPFDVGVALLSFFFSRHAAKATLFASSAFVAASILWYRKGWTNLWGTRPTAGLPLYAVATTAMIALRFAEVPRPRPSPNEAEPKEAQAVRE